MKKPGYRYIALILLLSAALYWLPFAYISTAERKNIIGTIDGLQESDAVLVFGTLVTKERGVSPLLRERLDAGIEIMDNGKCGKIVVSNMKAASQVMADYLYQRGVQRDVVEIDPLADDTPDTCRFERKNHPEGRRVIFVSQGFHLPRILYQCRKAGVEGTAFPAEKLRSGVRMDDPLPIKVSTRIYRYTREAGLTWLAVLGIYR